ncbi:hypothetical protein DUI87_22491 [Hirundo rustica rustica]|uniref:Uncharacterized protein n=1 Tax=Hirundo rustica rustica TaxID=333673 RepID=A0A3M0K105_HIRRU|nr:hypothetical protein DUI87_22491 [Hirundo rustica rustica]
MSPEPLPCSLPCPGTALALPWHCPLPPGTILVTINPHKLLPIHEDGGHGPHTFAVAEGTFSSFGKKQPLIIGGKSAAGRTALAK